MRLGFSILAARCIDAVRLHRTSYGIRNGIPGFHKCRRRGMRLAYGPGNLFLRWSGSGIQMFGKLSEWQKHEVSNFRLCHPERVAESVGNRAVFLESLPGRPLRELVREGNLDQRAVRAAAVELRRVHALSDPANGGSAWSHGDPHLGNLLYDTATDRCYLIDFETMHFPSRPVEWRQADDLLTVCLELAGSKNGEAALAEELLRSYGLKNILGELAKRLNPPRGLQRILWATRTDYLPMRELTKRLERLRLVTLAIGCSQEAVQV